LAIGFLILLTLWSFPREAGAATKLLRVKNLLVQVVVAAAGASYVVQSDGTSKVIVEGGATVEGVDEYAFSGHGWDATPIGEGIELVIAGGAADIRVTYEMTDGNEYPEELYF